LEQVLTEARYSHVSISGTPPPNVPLPLGLVGRDVGAVSEAGSATVRGSVVSVRSSGTDIWGTSDQFFYVQHFLQGNGEMTARVLSLEPTSPYAKAGIMIRESPARDDSAHVFLGVKPDGGIEMLAREDTGEPTSFVSGGYQPFPAWLRLTRNGLTYTGFSSADGVTWNVVGQIQPSRQWDGAIGLAVTSQNNNAITTADFDSISLSMTEVLPAPWGQVEVGNTGVPGSAVFDSGQFTIRGAGADIWGRHDAFHFLVTGVAGDQVTLSARVVSQTNTSPWAKAGVMIRPYVNDDSPFVMIALKPNGEIELLQRSVTGADVAYLGGAMPGLGSHLRLQRAGSQVSLSYSTDGVLWNELIVVPVDMPNLFSVGLAVLSHDVDQLNTAVFDHVVLN
jgi:regulation of enolase protein 1 (concanavalin A-like superfamily)